MKSNLHIHSKYSDGKQWPEEIVKRAKNCGLELISLTDHDSMEGVPEFLTACDSNGIKGLAGVEIDCVIDEMNYDSEILAYFPDNKYEETNACLKKTLNIRKENIRIYIENAIKIFDEKNLNFDEMAKMKLNYTPPATSLFTYTKPDLYNYLIGKGVIANITYPDFKKKYAENIFRTDDPKPEKLEMKDIVALIKKDGGYPVLPHPGYIFNLKNPSTIKTDRAKLRNTLNYVKDIGVWGLEFYYCYEGNEKLTAEINSIMQDEAEKLGLRLTYGSDCHGIGSHNDNLCKFHKEFDIEYFTKD